MRRWVLLALATVALHLSGCGRPGLDTPVGAPGSPLPGLTEAELARFQAGRRWFDYGWTPERGLGPLYLQDRCSSCHDLPELGGTGVETRQMVTRFDPDGGCDPLVEEGGPVRQERATAAAQALGIFREEVPPSATERVREVAPLLYGLGLLEAIPEEAIEGQADPQDADGDGISGRVHRLPDGRLGRFTRKGEMATIEAFVARAFISDLGLTSPAHPEEERWNGSALPPGADPVPDPELDPEIIAAVADFVRFLAPPAREAPGSEAVRDSIAAGEVLFREVGCASCHTPTLRTGRHPVQALSEKTVHLYSDLLLHDLGPAYPGVCAGDAAPTEFRTGRLMGLRHRAPYAPFGPLSLSLEHAVLAHGGEAQRAREAFEALGHGERGLVLRFLRSL